MGATEFAPWTLVRSSLMIASGYPRSREPRGSTRVRNLNLHPAVVSRNSDTIEFTRQHGDRKLTEVTRTDLFPSPLWASTLPRSADYRGAMIRRIESLRSADPAGRSHSNSGGWQSTDVLHHCSELQPFLEDTQDFLDQVAAQHGIDKGRARVVSCWANVNPPGAYNTQHVHGNSVWSGAYFLAAGEDQGGICFSDPRPAASMVEYPSPKANGLTSDRLVVPAMEGVLLVFPAYLPHSVERNASPHDRISIGLNFDFA